jgi:hypothetical protein
MIQLRKPILSTAACSLLLILSDRPAVLSQGNAGSFNSQLNPVRRGLSPEEKRGKAFYLRGESSSGQEITAMMGEIEVPATTLTCSGCHGSPWRRKD